MGGVGHRRARRAAVVAAVVERAVVAAGVAGEERAEDLVEVGLAALEEVVREGEELRALEDLEREEVEALEQLEVQRLRHPLAALGEELGLARALGVARAAAGRLAPRVLPLLPVPLLVGVLLL